jgi:hypothetical protein
MMKEQRYCTVRDGYVITLRAVKYCLSMMASSPGQGAAQNPFLLDSTKGALQTLLVLTAKASLLAPFKKLRHTSIP